MEDVIVDYSVANFNNVLKKYTKMVSRCTFLLYNKYKCVMDIDEAHQTVKICMWTCLKHYDPNKFKFSTYFLCSFNYLMKRYYYTHESEIVIAQNKDESYFRMDGESERREEEIAAQSDVNHYVRNRLSPNSVKVFDLFMKHYKISRWLISEELGVSRQEGMHMCKRFKDEVANLLEN